MDLPTVQTVLGHTTVVWTFRYAENGDNSATPRAARALDALQGRERGQPATTAAATEGGPQGALSERTPARAEAAAAGALPGSP
jgi:hypothetical protein